MNTPAGGVTLPELLPCPLCAGEAELTSDYSRSASVHGRVTCGVCGLTLPGADYSPIKHDAMLATITAWNRRAALAGEWRDVRESLPDYEGANEVRQHLVYHPANFGPRIVTEHPSWWNRKDPRGRAFDGEKVSHWMPLPAAPLPKEPGR